MAGTAVAHWLIAQGDTWQKIADAYGITRSALLVANGLPTTGTPAPVIGRVVVIPLAGP